MDKMIREHTGLVKSIAFRLSNIYREDFDDLVQIGFIGLIKAIRGFDENKGYKFSTYAVPLITGEIRSQLRDHGNIKVSRSIKSDINTIKKAEERFIYEHNRSPRISEISIITGLSEERVRDALQAQDAMKNMGDIDDINIPVREEDKSINKLDIRRSLDKLEKLERQVVVLRYYRDMTQSQVAKLLGISQVQVSRIEQKTLKNMAKFMVK